MTVKTVLKKLKLDESAFEKIRLSVKEAEQNTSGEIAVCLANESSDYSFWEFFASFNLIKTIPTNTYILYVFFFS